MRRTNEVKMPIMKWDDFLRQRDAGIEPRKPVVEITALDKAAELEPLTGKPLDATFRDEGEYKKMLEFLRGRKNTPQIVDKPVPPKAAPKGWFVVDEQSRGFWIDGGWSQETHRINEAMIDSEKAAVELARVVGGVAIPAEEIL